MKSFKRFLIIASLVAVAIQSATAQLEDRWLTDARGYERAVQLQRELGVPLVVYFHTDWCSYCRALESQYFPTAPVQRYLQRVVKVKINPEHGRSEQELADQYGVQGYPGFFVIRKPSSVPANVNPFRGGGSHLTPAQFASACERGLSSAGLVSTVRVTIKPTPLAAPPVTPRITASSISAGPKGDPIVTSVLDRYVEAIGGREVLARISSRVVKGRINLVGTNSSAEFEGFAKAPRMSLTVIRGNSIGLLKQGFDGHSSWAVADRKDALSPTPKELAALGDEGDLARETKLQELYPRMVLTGKNTVDDREVHILEATTRLGAIEKLYFDVQTGLLLRRDTTRFGLRGSVPTEIYFSDWRDVDGVKLPFMTTERMPNATYIFILEQVRHNIRLDDDVFRVPSR